MVIILHNNSQLSHYTRYPLESDSHKKFHVLIARDCRVVNIKEVKFSLYRPCRPLGLREVEAPTFSDIRLIDGGKVVSPTPRPLFTPRKIPGTHFC
jgi:hypothetical protein